MIVAILTPGRIRPRRLPPAWLALAGLLLALPAVSGYGAWRYMTWVSDYYVGNRQGVAADMDFRNRMGTLIERASFLQARTSGPVGYAWDAAVGPEPRRYLRTEAGVVPLEPIRPRAGGRDMAAGVVENGLGVIVVAVSSRTGSFCQGLLHWMSPFTRGRARVAWLPGRDSLTLPGTDEVGSVAWKPATEVMQACTGEGSSGSLLLRFDAPG